MVNEIYLSCEKFVNMRNMHDLSGMQHIPRLAAEEVALTEVLFSTTCGPCAGVSEKM